jgi:hypothetical protein
MTEWTGVTPEQVVAAMRQYVLRPTDQVDNQRDSTDSVIVETRRFFYEAVPAPWRIGAEPWVAAAVRIVADAGMKNAAITHGMVFDRAGATSYLNDVATMRALGRRVDNDLDPLAYAELLAELYSVRLIDQAVVFAGAATALHRSGELIVDAAALVADYPFVDPSLVKAPAIHRDGERIRLDFFSCHYYLLEVSSALDILQWTVLAGAGQDATWVRQYVVEQLEH